MKRRRHFITQARFLNETQKRKPTTQKKLRLFSPLSQEWTRKQKIKKGIVVFFCSTNSYSILCSILSLSTQYKSLIEGTIDSLFYVSLNRTLVLVPPGATKQRHKAKDRLIKGL